MTTDPTQSDDDLLAEATRLCEQALGSPAASFGPMMWTDKKLTQMREQAAYLAKSILALFESPAHDR